MLPSRKMVNDKLLRCHNIEGPDSETREKKEKRKKFILYALSKLATKFA